MNDKEEAMRHRLTIPIIAMLILLASIPAFGQRKKAQRQKPASGISFIQAQEGTPFSPVFSSNQGVFTVGENSITWGNAASDCSTEVKSAEFKNDELIITKQSVCYLHGLMVWTGETSSGWTDQSRRELWREVYGVRDGKLALIRRIDA